MRFLVAEKLGPHKFKTPEGYLICTDAILSRTGKQEYKRCEIFGDACDEPDKIVNVDRVDAEVFSDKAMASFENKPICIEHPDHDVNAENHNELAVGFVRDVHKGEDNGHPVMMGTLVITDKDAVEAVESGEYKELSCGYDCDIDDDDAPCQRNIRGNHVALCKHGRAGIARIVDSVDDTGIKVWQVRQGYAIVVKRYWQQYGKNAFVDATESSIDAARYHRGSLERNDKMDFVIIDCNDGKYKIEDSEMKDIQSTKAPGTDKIIYVMQSDVDKNLYFYIGKTFSMKEGNWGYTKFEMGNTTPEQLKAELSKNGWHAVSQGVARIIDAEHEVVTDEIMKDESRQTLIEKLRTVSVPYGERYALTSGSGWHIDIQHHGQETYESINKYPHVSPKESSRATIRLWYNGKHMKTFEGPLNSAKSDAIRYLQTRTEDSWSSVEEENYNKANKAVIDEEYVQLPRGRFMVVEKTKEELKKEGYGYHHSANGYSVYVKNNNAVAIKDAIKDEVEKNFKIYVRNIFGLYKIADWPAVSKEAAVKEFLEANPEYRKKGVIEARDSTTQDSKEQLFTVEYEQDGVTYVRKVRANSIEDAISKVKDDDDINKLQRLIAETLSARADAWRNDKQREINQAKENIANAIDANQNVRREIKEFHGLPEHIRQVAERKARSELKQYDYLQNIQNKIYEKYSSLMREAESLAKTIEAKYHINLNLRLYLSGGEREAMRILKTIHKQSDSLKDAECCFMLNDSKNEQLFTVEYEQNGVMYVRKVRASSIEDAIKQVKRNLTDEFNANTLKSKPFNTTIDLLKRNGFEIKFAGVTNSPAGSYTNRSNKSAFLEATNPKTFERVLVYAPISGSIRNVTNVTSEVSEVTLYKYKNAEELHRYTLHK